jgi:uncharacterized surface protein with fasciclin (FAS1) repeats
MKKIISTGLALITSVVLTAAPASADHHARLSGRVLLQVEGNGELWYVIPGSLERFHLKSASDMNRLMKHYGHGISNANLSKIPAYGQPKPAMTDWALTRKMAGYILIQVEDKGRAWYVNPVDHLRYELGRPREAFGLFKKIALGINNKDIAMYKESKSIVDIAVENGNFKTLVAAVQAAGLAETLDKEGPFTVMAPTDAAFAKLPAGTVEALLQDIPKLKSILLYHVVAGKVTSDQVVKLTEAKTLNGQSFKIKVDGSKVMVDNATVTAVDIMAENGVIHVIDTVILPQ